MVKLWYNHYWSLEPTSNPRANGLTVELKYSDSGKFRNPLDYAIDAVYQITRIHKPPYSLLVSGGIDSQFMIYVWRKSGVPFNIIHYNYDGLNFHDTETLNEYAEINNLKFKQYNIDAKKFIESPELIKYAKKYDCSSPQILTYIKLAESHKETVIMSGNTSSYQNHIGINYTLLALDRFRESTKNNFVPFFLSSTPDITFLQRHVSKFKKLDQSVTKYRYKFNLYRSLGAKLVKQKRAYTGFENIKLIYDDTPVPLKLRYKYKDKVSKRPFDILYRYGLYEHIPMYSERVFYKIED